jgi:hypothetical protein
LIGSLLPTTISTPLFFISVFSSFDTEIRRDCLIYIPLPPPRFEGRNKKEEERNAILFHHHLSLGNAAMTVCDLW